MEIEFNPSFKHFKDKCIICEEKNKKMNKEHYFPQWLLKRTKSEKVNFGTFYGKLPGKKCTVPICIECNEKLGSELESPVSKIFENIESDKGFNDYEAELLVRWIWKIQGILYWSICGNYWHYGCKKIYDKVLLPIEQPRSRISIAIALIDDEFENDRYGYAPVGLDSFSLYSNIFASGVFSKLSIIVFYTELKNLINSDIWSVYTLSEFPIMLNPEYKIYPKYTINTGAKAINLTKEYTGIDSEIHNKHEEIAYIQNKAIISVIDSIKKK